MVAFLFGEKRMQKEIIMKNNNPSEEFQVTDFYLCAFLLAEEMQFIGTRKEDSKKTIFILKDSPERIKLINDFYGHRALVDPLIYKRWIIDLKSLLHNTW